MPTTKPIPPTVPVPWGLATSLGIGGGTIFGVLSLVMAILNGDHTPETLVTLLVSGLLLATTIAGRMHQAAAIFRDAPSPLQGVQNVLGYVEQQSHDESLVGQKPAAPLGLGGGK